MNCELSHVAKWFKANKLTLNISKTNYMLFHTKKKINAADSPNLSIDGKQINLISHVKFLGVILDSMLDWKQHVVYTSSKLAKSIGIIVKVRRFLSKKVLLNLYYTFSYPYLSYCNIVWGSTYDSTLEKLNVLQRRIIRMITFSHHRTSVKAIFNNLRILTLQQINTFQTGIFMYQHTKGKSPDACLHMFVQNSSIHNHYTRQHQNLHIIRCRTKIKQFSIKYHGVKIWNNIPPLIKNYSYQMFKNYFKLYLLSQ